jgi:hypothetical protein
MIPILNHAAWAMYDPKGKIVYATIADTKEECKAAADHKFWPEKAVNKIEQGYKYSMIAIDIEAI